MRYRLGTLLILAAIAPPLLAAVWWWKEAIPALLAGFLIGSLATCGLFGLVLIAIWTWDVAWRIMKRRRGNPERPE